MRGRRVEQNGVSMPSMNDSKAVRPGGQSAGLKAELHAISATDSLSDRILVLTQRRQAAYERARTYRAGGQLVPGSLDQEMVENGLQLQQALERYTEATGG
jgi:hypothetical protein